MKKQEAGAHARRFGRLLSRTAARGAETQDVPVGSDPTRCLCKASRRNKTDKPLSASVKLRAATAGAGPVVGADSLGGKLSACSFAVSDVGQYIKN